MKVKDVMTKEVKTCALETDLSAVAQSMWMRDCGVLPVVDDKGQVVGMITDRDVCIATGCRRRDPATILVSEVMTRQVHSCSPDADVCEALQIMQQKQVRRLPVIDSAGKLCGVLSLNDVALKVQPDATAPEPCARDIHAVLRSICAHRTKSREASQAQAATASARTKGGRMKPSVSQKPKPTKERTMDTHQPEVFETTLQKTNIWLKDRRRLQRATPAIRAAIEDVRFAVRLGSGEMRRRRANGTADLEARS